MRKKGIGGIVEFFSMASILISLIFGFSTTTQLAIDLSGYIFLIEVSALGEQNLYMTEAFVNDSAVFATSHTLWNVAQQGGVSVEMLQTASSKNGILYWYSDDFDEQKLRTPFEHHGRDTVMLGIEQQTLQELRKYVRYDFTSVEFLDDNLPIDEFGIDFFDQDPLDKSKIVVNSYSRKPLSFNILQEDSTATIAELQRPYNATQVVNIPYELLYDKAVIEAGKAPSTASENGRKDQLQGETESLVDEITHEDVYCEPDAARSTSESRRKSGIRTSPQTYSSCTTLYESYVSGQGNSAPLKQLESEVSSWSSTGIAYSGTFESFPLVKELNTIDYQHEELSGDVSSCGCRLVPLCCVESHEECEATDEEGNCVSTKTVCDREARDPNKCSGCDVAYEKRKSETTCQYAYNYTADILVAVRQDPSVKVMTTTGWQDLVMRFMERFRITDSDVENSQTYRTGI